MPKHSDTLKKQLAKATFFEELEEKANTYDGVNINIKFTHDDGGMRNTGFNLSIRGGASINTDDTEFVTKLIKFLAK